MVRKMSTGVMAISLFLMVGMMATASADTITIGPTTQVQWTWQDPNPSPFTDPKYNNPDDDVVSWVTGNPVTELYKQEAGGLESGPLVSSYDTSFTSGNEDATIAYIGGSYVDPSKPAYLLVKDGNHIPIWYIYDLHKLDLDGDGTYETSWNGIDQINILGLWDGNGSISHVSLYGSVAVPEPGILILLGIAMSAVGIVSRYVRKI
jgi:hypothetical protein